MELLGTGDTIDPEIGGRVFKTKSSEDLAYLSRIVAWAKAARLVRVTGTKLMLVKKNAALTERPLDLVLALLEAYPRLGRPLLPRNIWRATLVGDEFTGISQELITALLRSAEPEDCGGPGGFTDLKDLLAGPPNAERDEMRTWAGGDYNPAHFDLTAANAAAASV